MASGKRARPSLIVLTLMAVEPALVALVAARYGHDGPFSILAAVALAPIAVAETWWLASGVAGPRFAVAAAGVYVVLPGLAMLPLLGGYRNQFAEEAVPNLLGLRATPWFALGLAIGAATLATRYSAAPLALTGIVLLASAWVDLGDIRVGLHETAWSIAMLEWLVVAAVVGLALRDRWRAAALGGWLAAAIALAARQGYADAAFWQSLSVATPAIAVLLSSLWLLLPPLRLAPRPAPER
jgi:hypothetical protein